MAFPDEPQLSACLDVLRATIPEARMLGYHGKSNGFTPDDFARLIDLMKAVHNLPELLERSETVDTGRVREELAAYDDKWGSKSVLKLLPTLSTA